MKNKIKQVLFWILIVIAIGIAGYEIYYQFTHPELTGTQLIKVLWKYHVGMIASYITAFLIKEL